MLGTSTRPTTPGTDDMFRSYPETPFTYKSPENSMRMGNNPSTDYLLARGEGSDIANAGFGFGGYPAPGYNRGGGDGEAYGRQQRFNQGLGMGLRSQSQESVTGVPLLQHAPQPDGEPRRARSRQGSTSTVGAPYPPTAYTQPVPHGYTPPGAPRQRSGSDLSYNGGGGSAGAPHQPQPWESNSDLSRSRQPSIGYGLPPGATMTGYNDSFAPSHVPRQGSASSQGQGQNRQSPPVQMDRYGSPGPILRHESPVSYSTPPPGSQDPRSQHPQGMRQPSASGPGGGMRPGGPRGPSGGGPPNQGRYEDPYGRYQ
ncbi:hypothetical protein BD324DRAFT_21317 [Kockovaella imperatae]|uniref:Uncharacterized protein n=1 Tax=Kockovaella imperatae TaxID=4999 RepID=A0A1Y1UTE1_9TREE|nr:hypothetical protein BD324DRAFT_21317 [Kockovaella imperatae]ORX40794.1 hypothetical protein BD324DRAFT_21317 [Kockovaella imperatae]